MKNKNWNSYRRSLALLWKRLPHFVQPKVLSALWTHECFKRLLLSLQVFPHIVQVFGGASSAWFCLTCSATSASSRHCSPHNKHRRVGDLQKWSHDFYCWKFTENMKSIFFKHFSCFFVLSVSFTSRVTRRVPKARELPRTIHHKRCKRDADSVHPSCQSLLASRGFCWSLFQIINNVFSEFRYFSIENTNGRFLRPTFISMNIKLYHTIVFVLFSCKNHWTNFDESLTGMKLTNQNSF